MVARPSFQGRLRSDLDPARVTGLEPAASAVTGLRSNQLSYTRERGVNHIQTLTGTSRTWVPTLDLCSGGQIRTGDLWLMGPPGTTELPYTAPYLVSDRVLYDSVHYCLLSLARPDNR